MISHEPQIPHYHSCQEATHSLILVIQSGKEATVSKEILHFPILHQNDVWNLASSIKQYYS